jgi:tetratricopeptide (TPR) repeat protein
MRDDFPAPIIEQLAKRVGFCCSNPGCQRPTSGPRDDPEKSINIGVAAHITAASPGGPRYDENLTQAERQSITNGISLCQICAKLVDNDPVRYTVEVLRDWKEGAEALALLRLEQPIPRHHEPTLLIPAKTPEASWLSYISRSTTFSGRRTEMGLLESFMGGEEKFLWWIITGPAGAGKSRLALELCEAVEGAWYAGFLSRTNSFNDWTHWLPAQPTLIVIDYVAGRAADASKLVLQLATRQNTLPRRVRVLLVERELAGSWWPDYLREGSISENVVMVSTQFGYPIHLGTVGDNALSNLVSEISVRFGVELSAEQVARTVALTKMIDPVGRPLFAMIAAAAQLTGTPQGIIGSILQREMARWKMLIPNAREREQALNLLTMTTVIGGFTPLGPVGTALWNSSVGPLLPSPHFFDDRLFRELAGGSIGESTLPSLQPDLVGEAFVLDRLKGTAGMQRSTRELIAAGWVHDPEAVSQFVRRAVADFHGHPAVLILQEQVSDTEVQRESWSRMIADLVTLLGDSEDAQVARNLYSLRDLAAEHPQEVKLQRNRAQAEFNFGNLLFQEGQYEAADEQFSFAIELAEDGSDTQANSLNNRGICRLYVRSDKEGLADFSAVIEMTNASDEVRACAFNNRADLLRQDGEVAKAVVDRSHVLALEETSYNRRFIAHIRRSSEYLELGKTEEALDDLAAILSTADILPEQKMQAHLQRAEILADQNRSAEALVDIEAVMRSPVNFSGTVPHALLLRGQIHWKSGEDELALKNFRAVLEHDDADGSTIAQAYLGGGAILATIGELDEARVALTAAQEHPEASNKLREQASRILSSMSNSSES